MARSSDIIEIKLDPKAPAPSARAAPTAIGRQRPLDVRSFLDADWTELAQAAHLYDYIDLPNVHRARRHCFGEWQLVLERAMSPKAWAMPEYEGIEVHPDRKRHYLREGMQYYALPGGGKRVAVFDTEHVSGEGARARITLIACAREQKKLRGELRRLDRAMTRRHYLRRQAFTAAGKLLARRAFPSWDDVVLASQVRQALADNTLGFLAARELFRCNRIPQRRGIILHGPPGNGKTLIGKALARQCRATFIYVSAGDVEAAYGLRWVFRRARLLRPTIIFLEDMDFYASERCSYGGQGVLGELLAQLDGLHDNDGIIVIGATNALDAIEPAIKDRPSRFDLVLKIDPPTSECRREIFARAFRQQPLDPVALDKLTEATAEFSGAQLREVTVRAIQSALLGGRVDGNGIARPDEQDLLEAAQQIQPRAKRIEGFGAGCSQK